MSDSFDESVRKTAGRFRPEPNLNWRSIEKRLESQDRTNKQVLYNWIAIAAGIALIVLSVFIYQSSPSAGAPQSLYVSAGQVSDLNPSHDASHRMGRYPVQEIYNAYQITGILPSGSSDLNGWR